MVLSRSKNSYGENCTGRQVLFSKRGNPEGDIPIGKVISVTAFTDDWILSARLAKICSDFGCRLSMPDPSRLDEISAMNLTGIIIFDLRDRTDQKIRMGSKVKKSIHTMVLGVTEDNIKAVRNKAIECGFQMVFTKRGFVRNLGLIIKQAIQNEPGN